MYNVSSQEFYQDFEEESFHRGFDEAHGGSEISVIDPEDDIPY
jgi:hypothetical protein